MDLKTRAATIYRWTFNHGGEAALGPLVLTFTPAGLAALDFGDEAPDPSGAVPTAVLAYREQTARELSRYFGGHPTDFASLPLDLRGTRFQLRVWQELRKLPWGSTISYGELAARIGKPRAPRAVGQAVGANPVAIIVPCHRVIATDGTLGGYAGGLDRKRWLLAHEGVPALAGGWHKVA